VPHDDSDDLVPVVVAERAERGADAAEIILLDEDVVIVIRSRLRLSGVRGIENAEAEVQELVSADGQARGVGEKDAGRAVGVDAVAVLVNVVDDGVGPRRVGR
jgi:hypothetical protein